MFALALMPKGKQSARFGAVLHTVTTLKCKELLLALTQFKHHQPVSVPVLWSSVKSWVRRAESRSPGGWGL